MIRFDDGLNTMSNLTTQCFDMPKLQQRKSSLAGLANFGLVCLGKATKKGQKKFDVGIGIVYEPTQEKIKYKR